MLKTIKQEIEFNASAHEVFDALMDEKKHAKFTGAEAKISRKKGGKFEAYGGGLCGKNIEIVQNKKILQDWRCEMPDWPKNHFSKAEFLFKEKNGKTMLYFTQTEVPEKCFESISQGWHDHYWKPMKKMLEKNMK